MVEVEIGMGKSARRGFSLDEIAIVPSRRTRDVADVDISWEIDAYRFELPVLAAASDGVTSPATAIAMGQLGGGGVLNLEGLWTRYEDPQALLAEISELDESKATERLQQMYAEPIKAELITARVAQIREAGVTAIAALTPQRVQEFEKTILSAELDLLVIQGTVVSAEHVSSTKQPLNLKHFIRQMETPVVVGGCASFRAALHLMRTGAAGVLVGVGASSTSTTRDALALAVPQATAIADVCGARMRHLDETGVYVHVIADGGMHTGGDVAKAIVCGADAVMMGAPLAAATEAPAGGSHWSMSNFHPELPRGSFTKSAPLGTLKEVLTGPAGDSSGTTNLFGALRSSMAKAGYETLKDFQRADIVLVQEKYK